MRLCQLGSCLILALAACGESQLIEPSPDGPSAAIDAGPDAPIDAPEGPCIPAAPTIVLTPRVSPPTRARTAATFDVAITNNDTPACPGSTFEMRTRNIISGLVLDPRFDGPKLSPLVRGGGTAHLTIEATPSEFLQGERVRVNFDVIAAGRVEGAVGDSLELLVAPPSDCDVVTLRELMITDLSVVDDPLRTGFGGDPGNPRTGAWTFKRLVEAMAPAPADAPRMVEAMLRSFTTTQTLNGFEVRPRPLMQAVILDTWPRTADGALDLRAAPLALQAIVNRFDLRDLDRGDAGEARFVFAFMSEGFPLEATIIFEYKLPAANDEEALAWARSFHALGALPFSDEYNAALQAITDRFAGRGARPANVNGSAINAVRTNEIAFGFPWQLRSFALSPATGMLVPEPVDLTPDQGFNGSETLARFVNANAAAILAERHTVPDRFEGAPFRGGSSPNTPEPWLAPGIIDNEARHHFALNTCNGCHSIETGTGFLHIRPRFPGGGPANLSGFLTGNTVLDLVDGVTTRSFDDLGRRRADLAGVVCPPAGAKGAPSNLRRGIARVH